MSNAVIAYNNLADSAGLVSTSNQLLLPVTNIQNPNVSRKWRGIDTIISADSVILDLGTSQNLDTIAILGITGNTLNISISNTDPTGTAGEVFQNLTIAVDQNYLSSINLLPNIVSGRYVRIDVFNNPGTSVEIGRVFIGVRTQFAYNYIAGWQRTWVDLSTRTKTLSGQTQIFPRAVYRTYDVSFDFLKENDRDGFVEDIDRVNALQTDVLFITNPDSTNLSRDTVWGLMTTLTPVIQPSPGIYTKEYQIEERL